MGWGSLGPRILSEFAGCHDWDTTHGTPVANRDQSTQHMHPVRHIETMAVKLGFHWVESSRPGEAQRAPEAGAGGANLRRLGPKGGSLISVRKMRCWNSHTVLFQNGKAWAYHITGLFRMREGLFKIQEGFLCIHVGVVRIGDGL